MKRIHLLLVGSVLALLLVSCSTKKNKYLNRNYHALTAGYNLIFNGEEALKEGKENLIVEYVDDFWHILPVERINIPLAIEREIGYEDTPTLFSRAEEKAIIAIQKHGMYIDGRERNPRIAEAYLLLGKSRYYDSRFIPAIDAFNFILTRYPASKSINDANIWRAKTYVRLENEEVAIDILKQTLKRKDLKREDTAEAAIMIAQAYIQMDSLPEALPYLQKASKNTINNEKKGRYRYIEGQLYSKLQKPDSAALAFDKVIDLHRRTLRNYYIHAHLEKINNTSYTSEKEKENLEKLLLNLKDDRENRPYLDHINYNIALYYQGIDSLDLAATYFKNSIEEYNNDDVLQALNYNALAEVHFSKALYKEAGAFYESALGYLAPTSLAYRRTKKKRDNLEDVVKYEKVAHITDSIIGLVNMSPNERLDFFTKYTDDLKSEVLLDSLSRAKSEQIASKPGLGFRKDKEQQEGSNFYFYNSSRAAYGKLEFEQVWGRRVLEDYWRLSNKRSGGGIEDNGEFALKSNSVLDEERFNPQAYIEAIPTDSALIDSIVDQRDFAYYQLGLIYKEKFKNNSLARSRLEYLLDNKPKDRLTLPAKYHLYRIYEEEGDVLAMNNMRNQILTEHPDSRYAEIIRNPASLQEEDANSPEYHYNLTFELFKKAEYQQALDKTEAHLNSFIGDEIISKFELLKATLIGRMYGYTAYEEALNFVALNYPNTPEGKQAERIHSEDLPKLAFTEFSADTTDSGRWKLIYPFSNKEIDMAKKIEQILKTKTQELGYTSIEFSLDYYNPDLSFIVLHGLSTKEGAKKLADELHNLKEDAIEQPSFEISSSNYAKVLVHKNLDAYLTKEL